MNLLMISGDRSLLQGKKGAFWYTLESFSKEWDRIDVLCPNHGDNRNLSEVFFGNVHVHANPRGLRTQIGWIKKKGAELFHDRSYAVMTVHDFPPFYNGLGARALSKKIHVPYVLEIHHIVGHPVAASLTERIGRILSRRYIPWASKKAAAIRTVSTSVAKTLLAWGVKEKKLRVVPSFYLDRHVFESLPEVPRSQYDVVFSGRLVPNKGAEAVLRAVAKIPKTSLLIIGDGPDRTKLMKLADSLGIRARVEFNGWLQTREDVYRAMRKGKMLVMNSTSEGGPRVTLEAMACGLPVISTRVGVMPDVLEDGVNGLFTTGTPEDLSHKILELLSNDEKRMSMGQQARRILDRFDRTNLISKYATFLRSAA